MNKVLLLVAAALLTTSLFYINDNGVSNQFQSWKIKYGKKYSTSEDTYRLSVFQQNLNYIMESNAQGNSFTLGENQFMDLTDSEFESLYMGGLDNEEVTRDFEVDASNVTYPEKADHSSVLNAIKNQGQCGSCWAFSAVGAMEAYQIIVKGQRYVLAEQQLNDCDSQSYGCDGGFAGLAIDYLNKVGAALESQYPYVAVDQTCKVQKGSVKANGRNNIQNANDFYEALSKYPVSVSVHASNWKLYTSGIFNDCINTSTNHAVVAVGYDEAGNIKIRNSWGPAWGEAGHIRLAKGNTCGVMRRNDQVV